MMNDHEVVITERGIVSRRNNSFFSYQSWPSACVDENGVIYVVCSGFRMGHMCPFGKITMYKSRDGGKTFTLPSVINDRFLDDRDPGILYIGEGKMIVTYCSNHAAIYENEFAEWIRSDSGEAGSGLVKHYKLLSEDERTGGSFYRILTGYGEYSGDEKRIPVHSTHGPVLLSDGRIFYLGKEVFEKDENRKNRFYSFISDDCGNTFKEIGECKIPGEYSNDTFHEVHCVQLDSGRILAFFRSHLTEDDNYFTLMKTYTDDFGKTWSKWEETGICGSPPHLLKIDGGAILSYGRRAEPYGIYAVKLDNNGDTAGNEIRLADCFDDDIGYPATVSLKDGSLFTVYYARCKGDDFASLHYVKWKI